MCLILFSPDISRAKITQEVLAAGFRKNDDGAGIAYVEDNVVKVSKFFSGANTGEVYNRFLIAYQDIRARIRKGPILIHFRWATCGSKSARNTQPVIIYQDKLVMAHNGVFSGLSHSTEDISDTVQLAQSIKRMKWEHPFPSYKIKMLDGLCDMSSKLVFLDNNGRHTIVNEEAGGWEEGVWYSDGGITHAYENTDKHKNKGKHSVKSCVIMAGRIKPQMRVYPPSEEGLMAWQAQLNSDYDNDPVYRCDPLKDKRTYKQKPNWKHGEGYDESFQLGPRPPTPNDV